MRVLIGLVVFLCATSCVSVADGEEARKRNGRYDVTELRKLAAKGRSETRDSHLFTVTEKGDCP